MIFSSSPPSAALISRETNEDGSSQSGLGASAIIVIVLVAAGFAVLVGFATIRFYFTNSDKEQNPYAASDEQQVYMREVRLRNVEGLSTGRGNKQAYAAEREYYPSHETGVSTPTSFVSKEQV